MSRHEQHIPICGDALLLPPPSGPRRPVGKQFLSPIRVSGLGLQPAFSVGGGSGIFGDPAGPSPPCQPPPPPTPPPPGGVAEVPKAATKTPSAVHIPTPGSDRDRDRFPTGLWGRGRSARPVWPDGSNPPHSAHPQMNFSSRRRGERRRRRGCRSTRRAGPGCVHPYGPTGP